MASSSSNLAQLGLNGWPPVVLHVRWPFRDFVKPSLLDICTVGALAFANNPPLLDWADHCCRHQVTVTEIDTHEVISQQSADQFKVPAIWVIGNKKFWGKFLKALSFAGYEWRMPMPYALRSYCLHQQKNWKRVIKSREGLYMSQSHIARLYTIKNCFLPLCSTVQLRLFPTAVSAKKSSTWLNQLLSRWRPSKASCES